MDGWFRSERLEGGVTLIWESHIKPFFRCNIWHVRGRERNLLVDSGFGLDSLTAHFPELGERSLIAFASHTHWDHVGGHHEFPDRAVHRAEAEILARPTRFNTVIEQFAREFESGEIFEDGPPAGFDGRRYAIRPAPASRIVEEGHVIDLGDRVFEVLHIPGHSPGSVALWERRSGILFSGDVVHAGPAGIGNLVLYHSNEDDYLASVERLRRVPVSTVHAGHFESFGRERYLAQLDDYRARKQPGGCPAAGAGARAVS